MDLDPYVRNIEANLEVNLDTVQRKIHQQSARCFTGSFNNYI